MSFSFGERTATSRGVRWLLPTFLLLAVVAGGLVTATIAIPSPLRISPLAVIGVLVFALSIPFLLRHWTFAVGVLVVWLVLEDLFRKLAGNDIRLYFVKDAIFVVVIIALFLDPANRRRWQEATGGTRYLLYALVAWALIMSVPAAAADWRVPLLGLRLDFMYAPLVVAGFALGSRRATLRASLLFAAGVAGAVSLIGIFQATIGPSFLSPGQETPGLINLELFRGVGSTVVYRPTATFVDPGRFASLAVLGLAMSLAAFTLYRGRRRLLAVVLAALNGGGVWVSGGRAGLVIGVILVLFAAVAGPLAEGRLAISRALVLIGVVASASVVLASVLPGVVGDRLEWYSQTLDPRSANSEWTQRGRAYVTNTRAGLEIGGVFGRGTGTESLGKQYLSGDPDVTYGRYTVEGGYASIAVEWGILGVGLWLAWSISWVARQWRAINAARGHRSAAAGFVLLGWMLFFLFFGFVGGLQGFQNYVANAYFWLLSGVMFALPQAARDQGPVTSASFDAATPADASA
jgi:hypothetical protein